ncbi:helix-turn-helix transcriptional regulator [Pseudoruegeria sp. HB172150]|uniref:ArsR/SmtB family transcription factor n=1 Tax=Pseudoruegeria sp. HB172150 TaxID=2721164 RepID=UPI001556825B|nr:metalloregulator ArsR/SmtB family transcription factor [Pseudoruegeria sp. HB172150]
MSREHVFSALSNPVRRELLELLIEGEETPGRLAESFSLSRSAVSEHLSILREAGLVTEEIIGRERLYSLNVEPLRQISSWLRPFEHYWQQRLAALGAMLEEDDEE